MPSPTGLCVACPPNWVGLIQKRNQAYVLVHHQRKLFCAGLTRFPALNPSALGQPQPLSLCTSHEHWGFLLPDPCICPASSPQLPSGACPRQLEWLLVCSWARKGRVKAALTLGLERGALVVRKPAMGESVPFPHHWLPSM